MVTRKYEPENVERGLRDLILYEFKVQPVALELIVQKHNEFLVRLTLPYLSGRKNKDVAHRLKLFLPLGFTLDLSFKEPT